MLILGHLKKEKKKTNLIIDMAGSKDENSYKKAFGRILLITYILMSSVNITLTFSLGSVLCLFILFASYLVRFGSSEQKQEITTSNWNLKLENPFKGKFGSGSLTQKEETIVSRSILKFILYDAEKATSLQGFDQIKKNTECVFSKRARLWGSPAYDFELTLEGNIRILVPTFYKFTMTFQSLKLDAFVIEVPGSLFGSSIEVFGKAVYQILTTLHKEGIKIRASDMKVKDNFDDVILQKHWKLLDSTTKHWDRKSWVFEFNRTTFFVTTFAPFYPDSNSRFSFGCRDCYVLFQPELSFAIHDLPDDTAHTNWDRPANVRDRIRIAYKEAEREYDPPMATKEPMIYDIVKRCHPQDDIFEWWSKYSNTD